MIVAALLLERSHYVEKRLEEIFGESISVKDLLPGLYRLISLLLRNIYHKF